MSASPPESIEVVDDVAAADDSASELTAEKNKQQKVVYWLSRIWGGEIRAEYWR